MEASSCELCFSNCQWFLLSLRRYMGMSGVNRDPTWVNGFQADIAGGDPLCAQYALKYGQSLLWDLNIRQAICETNCPKKVESVLVVLHLRLKTLQLRICQSCNLFCSIFIAKKASKRRQVILVYGYDM